MGYEAMGEWHDLFMTQAWQRLRPTIARIFGDLTADEVVVDLAAGTGLGTMALVDCTSAEVWAVEPELTMRTGLLHRVAADPGARRRVSVLAGRIPQDLPELPTPVSGVLIAHAIGHLNRDERDGLWRWCAQVLTPSGKVLVTCPEERGEATKEEEREVEVVQIGRHRYQATYTGAAQTSRTRYEVVASDGTVIRAADVEGSWTPVSAAHVVAEAGGHGLAPLLDEIPGVVVLGHATGRHARIMNTAEPIDRSAGSAR